MRATLRLVLLLPFSICFFCKAHHSGEETIRKDTIGLIVKNGRLLSENIHPKAKALLTEKFYFDLNEPSAPFGNAEGREVLSSFIPWRKMHPKESPITFLNSLMGTLGYPKFDLENMQLDKISEYISSYPDGPSLLTGQDNAVIALAFTQFMAEGRIDPELKRLTIQGLQRELLPVLIDHFPPEYQATRRDHLSKMLDALK